MASYNGERSSQNGGPSFRHMNASPHANMRSPPPPFRPPPPMAPPPLAPASPMTRRKLSVNAPFEQANTNNARGSPGPSPNPPGSGFRKDSIGKRPVEKVYFLNC
jgi:hypothetical protein